MKRRTLADLNFYPTPQELYTQIQKSEGWPYKTNLEYYKRRDKALCSILYLLGLRISEAIRLNKTQFQTLENMILVRAIQLSKRKEGKTAFRQEGFLSLTGERRPLTLLVKEYLANLEDEMLFPFSRQRGFQIVTKTLGIPPHWLRAFCENYLYDNWKGDLLAVADYMKIHPRTLPLYIRKSYKKYQAI